MLRRTLPAQGRSGRSLVVVCRHTAHADEYEPVVKGWDIQHRPCQVNDVNEMSDVSIRPLIFIMSWLPGRRADYNSALHLFRSPQDWHIATSSVA